MDRYSNNYKILTECECGGVSRPALEHNINCPMLLGFWGAPSEWGVGKIGETRIDSKNVIYDFYQTWEPSRKTLKEINQEIREKKLNKIKNLTL